MSSHHLGIEVGRHARPSIPVKDRVCTVCIDKVDDEIHLLTECKKHEKSRNCMLNDIADIYPYIHNLNGEKLFIELLTTYKYRNTCYHWEIYSPGF